MKDFVKRYGSGGVGMTWLFAVCLTVACQDMPAAPLVEDDLPLVAAFMAGDTTVLTAHADTYTRLVNPNQNRGDKNQVWVRGQGGKSRGLVSFDPAAIQSAVGSGTLESATLVLQVDTAFDWGSAGRYLGAFQMSQAWTELGVTYNCADDTDTSNSTLDCTPANQWDMGGAPAARPYAAAQTDSVLITNSSAGATLLLDVTADVAAQVSGGNDYGWLLTKVLEDKGGQVKLASRETGSGALLRIVMAQQATLPLLPPDSAPDWLFADTALVDLASGAAEASTHVALVWFDPTSSEGERLAAVASVNGVVVGGVRLGPVTGGHYVRIGSGGTLQAIEAAIVILEAQAGVRAVDRVLKMTPNFSGLEGADGSGWANGDWVFVDSLAAGANWSLEASNFPLAWGCSVGDAARPLVVLDHGFEAVSDLVAGITYSAALGIADPSDTFRRHGSWVTSVLAAQAGNGNGITGATWNRAVTAHEVWPTDALGQPELRPSVQIQTPTWFFHPSDILGSLISIAGENARAVNYSQSIRWPNAPPSTKSDSTTVREFSRQLDVWLQDFAQNQGGEPPLFVVAAGNSATTEGSDAFWSGWPSLNDGTRPILVVGAYDSTGAIWVESKGGTLVDVVAPGVEVTALDAMGPVVLEGTSFAAPQATALANLLGAFDPSLTAVQLRDLIIAGAIASGDSIGGYPVLDAYESLRLAAQKPGTPLCGNRMWLDGSAFTVERAPGMDDVIFTASGDVGSPTSYHGGRRIDYSTPSGPMSLSHNGSAWSSGPLLPTPTQPELSAFAAADETHAADSSIAIFTPGNGITSIFAEDVLTGGQLLVFQFGGFAVVQAAFSPADNAQIVWLRELFGAPDQLTFLDRSTGTGGVAYEFDPSVGTIAFMQLSHDGREALISHADAPGSPTSCTLRFVPLVVGATPSRQLSVAPSTQFGCGIQTIRTPDSVITITAAQN